ncbi:MULTISPECIES: Coenzyme F420 hydrogenase/dehydrogenase, beta subunit C-terminal domain [unclassified Gordonia (in: high G+C Gram-positive bacteria)]|uniref:Coenzyme F420 hydrogenase/dehydrogenase, beta subunit C-terminal domain n=1 Tax=unclassified Gordonia (in: high G+C Gram-positive bacteria) TaxID=2657482 RepID=UPI0019646CF9|nr:MULTISPECIES: Coenzyme F420 hydrogenase/dehydrogenase, beta subunit C-terminal domain [unclassified Gordonia (in: high G+C Gram-positive bacteria)]MBN0974530.1 Coenzyme F420 hydrogenase/dehydrogenase, beta subunit C-terminal domain [Gordonia sp. BP-119]MBN0984478.1 Coenzyme F420 hydrogenase/dehydrogenase, beta subunit C-terminal domain [Gordonia sp. BP-94]
MHNIENVVDRQMCVGCGACSVATGGAIPISISTRQSYEADITGVNSEDRSAASAVCPFSDDSKNEDELAEQLFSPDLASHSLLGKYSDVFAGRLSDDASLLESSSGGLTSWVASRLVELGHVDGVVHMGPSGQDGLLFKYQVSYSGDAVRGKRKSMYYSASFAEVVESIRGDGKKYAFVGVPCFVRAIRLLGDQDSSLADQVAFCLGLVCGHLKSFGFAESLAWQAGVSPDELAAVDFRVKDESSTASRYRFGARRYSDSEFVTMPTAQLTGGSWGHGFFQLNACNYCDDIFAETADVVFGDAWIPAFSDDWRGTNVVVSRNDVIDKVLQDGVSDGSIDRYEISAADAAKSQAGNFRHRRVGLSLRLKDDVERGLSVPVKRVAPGGIDVSPARARVIRTRRLLSLASQEAFVEAKERGSLDYFLREMKPLLRSYRSAELASLSRRRALSSLLGQFRRSIRASTRRLR